MKNRVLAVLAATALVGVASAFAANPFSDVPTNSWAYQAVTQLQAQGIVVGYPDGYFKGEKNITRYEMAQIIARAMVKEDRANAEQRAMLAKLANEFSSELNNLGVRVSALENKVGNVALTGDAEMTYQHVKGEEDEFGGRVRLNAKAKVDDSTSVGARLVAKMGYGDNEAKKNVTFDRLWVKHNMGAATVAAGRMGVTLGDGLAYDTATDGVELSTNVDKVGLTVGYGYPVADTGKEVQNLYVQLGGEVAENINASAYYARFHDNVAKAHDHIFGVAADASFDGFSVSASWAKTGDMKKNTAWTAGVGFGNYDQAVAGTWGVSGKYFHYDENFAAPAPGMNDWAGGATSDFKTWGVNGSYALADNLGLEADYFFHGKKVSDSKAKVENLFKVALKYQF